MKSPKNRGKMIGLLVILVIVGFFSSCAYLSHKGDSAFNATKTGESKEVVITNFDMPFVTKASGVAYPRYAAEGCKSPCAERLWFPNRLSFDIEAWSVDIDGEGHVVDKAHWNSP